MNTCTSAWVPWEGRREVRDEMEPAGWGRLAQPCSVRVKPLRPEKLGSHIRLHRSVACVL